MLGVLEGFEARVPILGWLATVTRKRQHGPSLFDPDGADWHVDDLDTQPILPPEQSLDDYLAYCYEYEVNGVKVWDFPHDCCVSSEEEALTCGREQVARLVAADKVREERHQAKLEAQLQKEGR